MEVESAACDLGSAIKRCACAMRSLNSAGVMGWTREPSGARLSKADGSAAEGWACAAERSRVGAASAPTDVATMVCCKNRRREEMKEGKGDFLFIGGRFIRRSAESQAGTNVKSGAGHSILPMGYGVDGPNPLQVATRQNFDGVGHIDVRGRARSSCPRAGGGVVLELR